MEAIRVCFLEMPVNFVRTTQSNIPKNIIVHEYVIVYKLDIVQYYTYIRVHICIYRYIHIRTHMYICTSLTEISLKPV
jgi:hypothetical protein